MSYQPSQYCTRLLPPLIGRKNVKAWQSMQRTRPFMIHQWALSAVFLPCFSIFVGSFFMKSQRVFLHFCQKLINYMLTSNIEKEHVRDCIIHKMRCDGRELFDYRKVQIGMLNERGSLELRIGNTRVLARVKADIVQPKPDRPSQGPINFKVDTSIKGQESRKLSTEISKLFEKIIKGSNAIDPSSLCITTGKYVWSLNCQTTLINDDGNAVDALFYGLIISLLDFRKPGVKVQKGQLSINTKQTQQALSIHHIPITFTFGLMDNGVFLDPHRKQQDSYDGRITICMNIYKDICSIHKPGGMPIEPSTLLKLTDVCQLKVGEFTNFIRNVIVNREEYQL